MRSSEVGHLAIFSRPRNALFAAAAMLSRICAFSDKALKVESPRLSKLPCFVRREEEESSSDENINRAIDEQPNVTFGRWPHRSAFFLLPIVTFTKCCLSCDCEMRRSQLPHAMLPAVEEGGGMADAANYTFNIVHLLGHSPGLITVTFPKRTR